MNSAELCIARGSGPSAVAIAPPSLFTERSALTFDPLMPRVPDNFLDAVAFLLPASGGSGGACQGRRHCVYGRLAYRGRRRRYPLLRALHGDCRHVAWGSPVIRLNRKDGNPPDIVDLDIDDWIAHPQGFDVAATCMLGRFDHAIHSIKYLKVEKLFSREHAAHWKIGIGDEVIMIGELVNYQGRRDNEASVRFGRISKPPGLIYNPGTCKDQESWAVEMHSRTGFSGSPVSVWRNLLYDP